MEVLVHPGYFPNCLTMAVIAQRDVIWEVWDNFQKQTYRNRCYIATDQGSLMLNIPIRHVGGKTGRQPFREVHIENSAPWQRQHWRGLATAYRSAPFFEYYEEDLRPLFEKPFSFLMELNLETISAMCSLLNLPFPASRSARFETQPEGKLDGRLLISAKEKISISMAEYTQVFQERHGFLKNLSTLDLLFNLGPAARDYLMAQELPWDA
ncbi:MAG: WbqC family protein [Robiginitalea sp.]|uniref:WbqC family protein n=2 Tax=Robiginitalea sp. TaxID=1902411 RepID=UPI003C7249A1